METTNILSRRNFAGLEKPVGSGKLTLISPCKCNWDAPSTKTFLSSLNWRKFSRQSGETIRATQSDQKKYQWSQHRQSCAHPYFESPLRELTHDVPEPSSHSGPEFDVEGEGKPSLHQISQVSLWYGNICIERKRRIEDNNGCHKPAGA
jgi:hypothetical protein